MIAPALLPLCLSATLAMAQDRVEAWSEDLMFLYDQIQALHPDPHHCTAPEEFDAAFDALHQALPELTDDQVTVELMRFMALLSSGGKDGHSMLSPARSFHSLPVVLYRFSDGWFVIAARDPELLGARLVEIEGTPIETACDRIRPLLNHDSDSDLLARLAHPLVMTELLHALGITAARERARLQIEGRNGALREVTLGGLSPASYRSWRPGPQPPLLPVDGAMWLSNPRDAWWIRVLPEERCLYAQYNQVTAANPAGETVGAFGARIVRLFEEQELERVVIDARLNGGGDNTTFGPLIEALQASERLNTEGRLYGLFGRHTFSAAGNFAAAFAGELNSILAGEETGGGPNQFGDARTVTLPNHPQLFVRISTRYHEFAPGEERLTTAPSLPVTLSSTEYFAGHDPVLRAVLEHPN